MVFAVVVAYEWFSLESEKRANERGKSPFPFSHLFIFREPVESGFCAIKWLNGARAHAKSRSIDLPSEGARLLFRIENDDDKQQGVSENSTSN